MLQAAEIMQERKPGLQFVIASASGRTTDVDQALSRADGLKNIPTVRIVEGQTYDLLKHSAAAAVTSGTATLEACILGTPMAIVYKTSSVNYKALRPLIRVPHFGLVNLIAGERLATELIQEELTPERLAAELERLLVPETNKEVRRKLLKVAAGLGGGASRRAAELILDTLHGD
jgi:lipid-A-disaccharide synthase